ncbi:serine hydrolase [Asticcacaulis sp. SL142]|uniref:serine hydrolase domain-containing protein n=1 Tax=Asticcacaulis sp. SL142 TaxID=2995155 RepID=UPI00226CF7D8|nr:serine hydrolase domain-containing protein [Asticcacaulis sp. SL142]WAC49758.1 serine hydrolase [Asticcacaulis sp. SL142]
MQKFGFAQGDIARLRVGLEAVRSHFDVPGIAAALEMDGRVIGAGVGVSSTLSSAKLTPDDRLPISCVMKVLVTWLLLYAEGEGKVGLDDDIAVYVPQVLREGERSSGITLRHLVTHTAGYIEPQENSARWGYSLEKFIEFFPRRQQAFEPGSVWSYTHTGHALVQIVLEKVFNRALEDLLRDLLLSPLGLNLLYLSEGKASGENISALHIKDPRLNVFLPMRPPQETGFLRFSISDASLSVRHLAKIGSALAGGYAATLAHLQLARTRLLSSAIKLPEYILGKEGERMPQAFCHGVADFGTFKGINGSYVGSTCALRFYEKKHLGLAAMINAYEPHVRDTVETMLGEPFGKRSASITDDKPNLMDLNRLVGRYEGLMLGLEHADVSHDGGGLKCSVHFKRGGGMTARLGQDSDGKLTMLAGSSNVSMAFAEYPSDRTPFLMVSTSAYRKVAA